MCLTKRLAVNTIRKWRYISTHSRPPYFTHRKLILCPGRFIPAGRAPFIRQASTALENTDVLSLLRNEPRLLRCPRKTQTQRTRCAVQHCCKQRAVPAQDSPGQGHILGPARWTGGISLSQLHISFRHLVVQFSHSARTFVRRHRISPLIQWTVTNDSTSLAKKIVGHTLWAQTCVSDGTTSMQQSPS